MESAMDLGVLVRFLVRTLGVFALIFILAVLTPKIAAIVDKWIKQYREHHDPKRDETYGIRSIYELPPKDEPDVVEDTSPEPENAPTSEQNSGSAESFSSTADAKEDSDENAPSTSEEHSPADASVPWFRR